MGGFPFFSAFRWHILSDNPYNMNTSKCALYSAWSGSTHLSFQYCNDYKLSLLIISEYGLKTLTYGHEKTGALWGHYTLRKAVRISAAQSTTGISGVPGNKKAWLIRRIYCTLRTCVVILQYTTDSFIHKIFLSIYSLVNPFRLPLFNTPQVVNLEPARSLEFVLFFLPPVPDLKAQVSQISQPGTESVLQKIPLCYFIFGDQTV